MHDEIETLLAVYPSARATTLFKGPHEVQRTFQKLKTQVERLPSVAGNPNLLVKYSYGKGNWATVPWLAILDSRETTSTQDGTYIVLLFSDEGAGCHLKLAQGVTAVKTSFGRRAAEELGRRAALVRESFPEMVDAGFDLSGDPKLGAEKGVAKLYEASTIFCYCLLAVHRSAVRGRRKSRCAGRGRAPNLGDIARRRWAPLGGVFKRRNYRFWVGSAWRFSKVPRPSGYYR